MTTLTPVLLGFALLASTAVAQTVGIVDITSDTQIWNDIDQTTTRIVGPKVHYGNGVVVPLQVRKCSLFGLHNPPPELSALFDVIEADPTPGQQRMLQDLSLWQCTAGLCAEQKILVFKELFCAKNKVVQVIPRMAELKVMDPAIKDESIGKLNYLKNLQVKIGPLNFYLAKTIEEPGPQVERICKLFGYKPVSFNQKIVIAVRSKFRPGVRPEDAAYDQPIEFVPFSPDIHQRSVVVGENGEFTALASGTSGRVVSGVYCGDRLP